MAKEFAKKFYKSKSWQQCRASYIVSVFGLCEQCQRPGYIVHHKIELTPNNINKVNITLNHDNLQHLCIKCHNKETFGEGEVLAEGLCFDSNGDLIKVGKSNQI